MTAFDYTNNASTTLAAAATSSATTLTLASSTNFPSSIPSGFVLPLTLNDAATRSIFEVCYVTAISGATVTVLRGQESTVAQNWGIGDFAYSTVTAAGLNGAANTPVAANGGSLNKFRNATSLIASRAASGTVSSATAAYTLDGHYLSATGTGLAWSQVAGIGYAPKALQLGCATGLTDASWAQPIEGYDAAPLAGHIVTVQATIKNNSGASITPSLTVKHLNSADIGVTAPWTGTPASSTTDISGQALQACANNATTTVAWTFTANAAFGNGAFIQLDFGGGLNAASGNIQIADFDIRLTPTAAAGLNSAPPIPEIRAITQEQLQCARYLPAFPLLPGSAKAIFGQATSTSGGILLFSFLAPTRIPTTGITGSPAYNLTTANGSPTSGGGSTFDTATLEEASVIASAFTSLVAGNAMIVLATTGSFIFTGAEL